MTNFSVEGVFDIHQPKEQASTITPPPYNDDHSEDLQNGGEKNRKGEPTTTPPGGLRINVDFPSLAVLGKPPCYELDGRTPLYFASAHFSKSVHPCKVGKHLEHHVRVGYDGKELIHQGKYDILPFDRKTMELVLAANGRIPDGRRPVEGGYEENGDKLYHAVAVVKNVSVPGKVGEHLIGGAHVPYDGKEHIVPVYHILCWK